MEGPRQRSNEVDSKDRENRGSEHRAHGREHSMKLRMKKCKCEKYIATCCQEFSDCSRSRDAAGSTDQRFKLYQSLLEDHDAAEWHEMGSEPLTIDDLGEEDHFDPVDPSEF
jgi:hypothetical protein